MSYPAMSKPVSSLLKSLFLTGLLAVSVPAWSQTTSAQTTPTQTTPTQTTPTQTTPTQTTPADQAGNGAVSLSKGGSDVDIGAPASNSNPAGLNMGQPVVDPNGPGSVYVRDTFGDWELRCTRAAKGQKETCLIYQLLREPKKNLAVAEITMFHLPAGRRAAAGATIIVPLETLLTKQLTLAVDGGPTKRYPFTWCAQGGCYARIGLSNADIASFKRGTAVTLTIFPVRAPKTPVALKISLKGFTKAIAAVTAANK